MSSANQHPFPSPQPKEVFHAFQGHVKFFTVYCRTNRQFYTIVKGNRRCSMSDGAFKHWPHTLVAGGNVMFPFPWDEQELLQSVTDLDTTLNTFKSTKPPDLSSIQSSKPSSGDTIIHQSSTEATTTTSEIQTTTEPTVSAQTTSQSKEITPATQTTQPIETKPVPSPVTPDRTTRKELTTSVKKTSTTTTTKKQPLKKTHLPTRKHGKTNVDPDFFTKVKAAARAYRPTLTQPTLQELLRQEQRDIEKATKASLRENYPSSTQPVDLMDTDDSDNDNDDNGNDDGDNDTEDVKMPSTPGKRKKLTIYDSTSTTEEEELH